MNFFKDEDKFDDINSNKFIADENVKHDDIFDLKRFFHKDNTCYGMFYMLAINIIHPFKRVKNFCLIISIPNNT